MADNPITKQLPADLPTNWSYGQTVAPSGAEAGLSVQHGYNYLMGQVNAAQEAINQVGEAFEDLATKNVTDGLQNQIDQKVPQTRTINGKALSEDIELSASDVGADPSGSAKTVQDNLNTHANNATIHVTAAEKSRWNTNTVHPLGYSKSGTQHRLTGLAGLSGTLSCVFKATAAFAAGDTFTVDGAAYAVQLSNGEAAEDNLFVSGATVPVVVDTAGKKVNFKAAGGAKLPAILTALAALYAPSSNSGTLTDTFVVPKTGKYRITVVSKGGNGASADSWGGSGGGSGGWCCSELALSKGDSYAVTVNTATSSFGNLLSATAGANGGTTRTDNVSRGGAGGMASGGKLYNYAGKTGGSNFANDRGSSGAAVDQPALSKFLCAAYGYSNGKSAVGDKYFRAFGAGGGGGSVNYALYSSDKINSSGGVGVAGAVIVELILE